METILLKHYSIVLLFQSIIGVIGVVTFIVLLIWLLREIYIAWREKKAKVDEQTKDDKKADHDFSCDHLTPMEWREKLLNNIECGRLYQITSPGSPHIVIACAKSYDAETKRLACDAVLCIFNRSYYVLYVIDGGGTFIARDFIGRAPLSIFYVHNPGLRILKESLVSPFVTNEDCQDFVTAMLKAGHRCIMEKGENHRLGSYTYRLKEQ